MQYTTTDKVSGATRCRSRDEAEKKGGKADKMTDAQKDVQELNEGKIDFAELKQQRYMRYMRETYSALDEAYKNKDWEEFIKIGLRPDIMQAAFWYYDEMPDSMKYDFAISAYIKDGDSIPAVRKAVRSARKYGAPSFPEDLEGLEVFTVYRAGEEPIDKAKYRISWTLSKEEALFFLNRYGSRARHLYRAKIRREDVIAYCNEREEEEIMQYRKVYDIEEIEA